MPIHWAVSAPQHGQSRGFIDGESGLSEPLQADVNRLPGNRETTHARGHFSKPQSRRAIFRPLWLFNHLRRMRMLWALRPFQGFLVLQLHFPISPFTRLRPFLKHIRVIKTINF
jgi:hypothetical protein